MVAGFFTAIGTLVMVVVILYLAYVCSKHIARAGGIKGSSRYIRMVDQIGVGPDRSIAIVQTGSQYLMLGITSSQVTLLKELQEEELLEFNVSSGPGVELGDFADFKSVMNKIRKRK